MDYKIRLGIPEVEMLWNDLYDRYKQARLGKNELAFFKKFGKALKLLSTNPKHNSLNSHEIDSLSQKYGLKIWQSYLENNVPAAGRIFWAYGPSKGEITILGVEPHPEDSKRGAYGRIKLSSFPQNKN